MPRPDEYQVEGYGVKTPEYDAPYLSTAALDDGFMFPHAGDPEAQAQYQKDIEALGKDHKGPVFLDQHPALQSAASEDTNKNSKEDASDYSLVPAAVEIDKGSDQKAEEEFNGDSTANEYSTAADSDSSDNSGSPKVNVS